MIRYAITPTDPHAHLFEVTMRVDDPAPEGQRLALPAWIPGSYMIREFARHIVSIRAEDRQGRPVRLDKIDKHTWRAAPTGGPLSLTYVVYAWDLSVRAAHLDGTHGFFNGSSVFLRVIGQEDAPCEVDIRPPGGKVWRDWRVATTLPALKVNARGFGTRRAADHDELIDHPVEMGDWRSARFEAGGAVHEVVLTGRHDADLERLAADLRPVCAAQAALFEPETGRAPVDGYLFLLMVTGDGYGGLEHRASTALISSRASLPHAGMVEGPGGIHDDYRRLLGLASHEYFHTWHVKRIKPAAFVPYDLDREQHTRLLWVFEGFTSYYDDLMLARAGVIEERTYLDGLAEMIGGVLRGPGRLLQSVAESSFDAWTKYYRQDENSPNAIVSYYAKGALVGLCLDLALRAKSRGERSLDDVLRLMWARFGRDFYLLPAAERRGVEEGAMPALVKEATGIDLSREIARWADGTEDPPLAKLLAPFGVRMERPAGRGASMGLRTATRQGELAVMNAYTNGAGQRAGLSAGDVIVAVDGLRANEGMVKRLLERRRAGDRVEVTAFRRDELMRFEVELDAPDAGAPKLVADPKAGPEAARLRAAWLGAGPLQPTATRKRRTVRVAPTIDRT